MAQHEPQVNGASIVLLGSFNPAIFQPQWFLAQNLLPRGEVETADIKMISPQICHFETGTFVIQVTTDRFAAISKPDANPALLPEFVAGTFFVLEHVPLNALGLNRDMHFQMPTEEAWHRVGDRLAPKDAWTGILKGRPGMVSLLIQGQVPELDNPVLGTRLNVKVEPSQRIKFGVYFQTNEQYLAPKAEASNFLITCIRSRWGGAYKYAGEIANHILDWASN